MEGTCQYCVYLGLALVSLLVVLTKRRRCAANGHGLLLPPGPWQLPVIGSLHHIAGQLPHHAMRDLAQRHGPVMLLRLGEVPTLVVSSPDAAREVMKTHDMAFATRPVRATVCELTNGRSTIFFAPYGDYWRQLRKITVTELLSMRRVVSFRAIREEEVTSLLRQVDAAAAAAQPVEMRARLSAYAADTTARTVIGDRCKDRDLFLRELGRAIELAAGFNPADLWPSSWLVSQLSRVVRPAKTCGEKLFGILDGIIQEHLERMDAGGDGEAEDLVGVLLRIQKDGGLQFPLDMDVIKVIIFDMFGAGSEATASLLSWAMAELIRNPKVMQKATAEVRLAFEADGRVPEHALGKLQYLHLVIRETLRLHATVPLLIPRESREPCQVLGYDVPRGTTVLVNVWAMGRDERYWPDAPDEFRPERFEDSTLDFKGADFEFLPFGAGRRMCPGIAFGLANVELPLASLLFHFDWEAPGLPDPAELDMTEAFGISARRKADLPLRPVLRVPVPGV